MSEALSLDAPDAALPATAADVHAAAARIAGQVIRTPMIRAERLSAETGADIWLKLESLQFTGAFKERGALNMLAALSPEQRAAGVVAASAGNHAQGLAHHARRLGVRATIVMPRNTPDVKVRKTRELGAEVILTGDGFDDCASVVDDLVATRGLSPIPPFDHPLVIAGQGTIALEMLDDAPELDVIVAPIGGGGLISGVALGAKDRKPDIDVLGVQAELYPSMLSALDGQERPIGGSTLAEGIAVKQAGVLTRRIISALVDEIMVVSERQIERALSLLLVEQKLLAEGAGAAGLAACLGAPERFAGRQVGLILCGGNIDTRLLSMILMRDLARAGRMARLRIELLDVPGQLVAVAGLIAEEGGNVIDVGHHRTYSDLPARMTCMDVTVDTQGQEHLDRILQALRDRGYAVQRANT